MAEIQGIQNINISDASANLSGLNTDSISLKSEDQLKLKVDQENSSEEEVVASDLSTAIGARSIENNAIPDLMNISANKSFVSKAEFMEAKLLKLQVAEAKSEANNSVSNVSADM